jgi:acyl transferase domain-containing protein/acyl carrier protein
MAEGIGMLVLERLSDARRNGHPVLAVITGSAVNQDGASNGLTAPNGPSQQRVIRAALGRAGLSAEQVDAVEAHGTGTALGDPIEAQALIATYGQGRPDGQPVWLGSVKSNIGHTVAAAGVAGVIKMVQALQHGVLPPTLHVDEPSPHVDWSAGTVRLLTSAVPWAAGGRVRRAAVSSFGISGTNAHAIVEEAPADGHAPGTAGGTAGGQPVLAPGPLAWLVSARSAAGLRAQASRLAAQVTARPELDPVDLGWSLATSRSVFEHRAVITGADRDELTARLAAVAAGRPVTGAVTGVARGSGAARLGFVFAGQGSQRAGMGADLHAASPVFAAAFDEACGLLEGLLGLPIADVVLGRGLGERADETVFAQAGLFAVQAGLVALLGACGVKPDAVAGHSVGEVAAAYAAGVLSLGDACRLVAARARLMQALPAGGAMTAIAAPEAEVAAVLAAVAGGEARDGAGGDAARAGVSVAAVNGPASVVISGDADAVRQVAEVFAGRGVRVRALHVSHAFHSHRMDPVLAELGQAAQGLEYRRPGIAWAGALTGELVAEPDWSYWVRQVREPVRYADAVTTLARLGVTVFVEIGPDGTLSALGAGAVPEAEFIPAQLPGQDSERALVAALARTHVHGGRVAWPAILAPGRRVDLPTYAFQQQRYWPEAPARPAEATAAGGTSGDEQLFWTAVEDRDLTALGKALRLNGPLRSDMSLGAALSLLSSWRRRDQENAAIQGWRYRVSWKSAADPVAELTGTWLVVAPATVAEPDRLIQALARHGARVLVLRTEQTRRAELAVRLREILPGDLAGVVSLLALEDQPSPGYPGVSTGTAATLALVQALGDTGTTARLWVLTQGAVSIGDADPLTSPAQAQAWGLGRSAALEQPARWGGLVDLPAELDDRAGTRLCGILAGHTGEDQVAIRAAGIFVRRLARAGQPQLASRAWRPSDTVLVTGDIAGPGAHIAAWLAGNGAEQVVLATRRGAQATGAGALAARLAGLGTQVRISACDLADRHAVAALLDQIPAAGPPLTAVVHAAGPGHSAALAQTGLPELSAAAEERAAGAAHLDELTKDRDLAAFVLCSSAAGVWGSGGQSAYGAANAYLDALASRRRARGQAAVSVAWGLWDHGGGAHQLERQGLRLMTPDLAIAALRQAVEHDEGQLTVAAIDWERFVPVFTALRPSPLLSDLPDVRNLRAGQAGTEIAVPDLARSIAAMPAGDRETAMLELVRGQTAEVLGFDSAEPVAADSDVLDLGMSSIYAVELSKRLYAQTGVELPAGFIYDFATPAAIADFLLAELANTRTCELTSAT